MKSTATAVAAAPNTTKQWTKTATKPVWQQYTKLPYGHTPFINKTMSTATRHIKIYLYLFHGSFFLQCRLPTTGISPVCLRNCVPMLSLFFFSLFVKYSAHDTRIWNLTFLILHFLCAMSESVFEIESKQRQNCTKRINEAADTQFKG